MNYELTAAHTPAFYSCFEERSYERSISCGQSPVLELNPPALSCSGRFLASLVHPATKMALTNFVVNTIKYTHVDIYFW